jgi:hypothetical protein
MDTTKSIIVHVVTISLAVLGGDYIDPLSLDDRDAVKVITEECTVTRQISQH